MGYEDAIRKLGFKRWYERQLIESHGYLVTCFLSMIVIAVALDDIAFEGRGWEPVLMLVVALGALVLAVHAWNQYRQGLIKAERVASEATCGRCKAYAAFRIVASGPQPTRLLQPSGELPVGQPEVWLRVRCRRCEHEWTVGGAPKGD
jgi:hypothetical protein